MNWNPNHDVVSCSEQLVYPCVTPLDNFGDGELGGGGIF